MIKISSPVTATLFNFPDKIYKTPFSSLSYTNRHQYLLWCGAPSLIASYINSVYTHPLYLFFSHSSFSFPDIITQSCHLLLYS